MEEKPSEGDKFTRRDFLTATSATMGFVGAGFASVPFIQAWSPTKDLLAAGIMEVDLKELKEGELRMVIWRKQPIFILRRTEEMIAKTRERDPTQLKDVAQAEERAQRPDLFVAIAICTHLGCIPKFRPQQVAGIGEPGFYCPCHGGKYDTLGRRLDGPPPENLHLLPYVIENDSKLILGTETFAGFVENIRKIQELPKA